jgi:uracil-DNA glycosylase
MSIDLEPRSSLSALFPDTWKGLLGPELAPLLASVDAALGLRRGTRIFPPRELTFRAFELTPPEATRVVIVGQDPYHGLGEAHGLAFSFAGNTRLPPSLRNIFKELAADLDGESRTASDLSDWAHQGVLLLNSILTVEKGRAKSHKHLGWEPVSQLVVDALGRRDKPCAFVLWGGYAQAIGRKISRVRHFVLESAHPSPLSSSRGFFGSKPFSQVNGWLEVHGHDPINWASAKPGITSLPPGQNL